MRSALILIVAGLAGFALPVSAGAIGGLPILTTPTDTTPTSTSTTDTTATSTTSTTAPDGAGSSSTQSALLPDLPALGLSVGASPPALIPFAPGKTATGSGTLVVLSPSGWTLTVADTTAGSPQPGHLIRAGSCSSGVAYLARPLQVTATPISGTSTGKQDLTGSPVTVATGAAALTNLVVTTAFEQVIGGSEALASGCRYSATVTFTLSTP